MSFWFRMGGMLLSAISLFSLVQKLWQFKFTAILSDLMTFYRQVFYPVADFVRLCINYLLSFVGLTLPAVPQDVIVLYCLVASAVARYLHSQREQEKKPFSAVAATAAAVLWPLLPLVVALRYRNDEARQQRIEFDQDLRSGASVVIGPNLGDEPYEDKYVGILIELFGIAAIVTVLFATNYYLG